MTDMIFFRISADDPIRNGDLDPVQLSRLPFYNPTEQTFQILVHTDEIYLCLASFARNMRSRTNTMCMRRMNTFFL